jgi:hypothetical protein
MACHVSSLQSKEEKDGLITQIKNGHLQIIVGTHALLTERMGYNNLGLLVVDEEQVFVMNCNVTYVDSISLSCPHLMSYKTLSCSILGLLAVLFW